MCDDNTDNDAGGAGIVCGLEEDGGPDETGLEVLEGIVPVLCVVPTFGTGLLTLPLFDLRDEEDNTGPHSGGVAPLCNNVSVDATGFTSVHINVGIDPVSWPYVSPVAMP